MDFTKLIKSRFINAVFFAEGGDGGGGGDGGEGDGWLSESEYANSNPEAKQAFSKYTTRADFEKGAHEAMKKVGKTYLLPEDHSKLTDEQKNEIRANIAKMEGVPETADGYTINIPEGTEVPIDDQGIADFKVFAKENNMPVELAQKCVDFQLNFVKRLNDLRGQAINEMTKTNFDKFSKEVGGESNAVLRMDWIKKYLQSCCLGDEGKPDKDVWESFSKRILHEDRMIELPLMRALAPAAQKHVAEGGAPKGGSEGPMAEGALSYPEMRKK